MPDAPPRPSHPPADPAAWAERERELRAETEMYRSLIEQLPVNVFRKDRAGRFVFVNAAHAREGGAARFVGHTDHEIYPAELADRYRADDLEVMRHGEAFEAIESHPGVDGAPGFVHVCKAPVRDEAGEVVGVQGFFVDVTELKRTEAALVARGRELERALAALEEQQARLVVAEKMASLGRLTAGIAHEMNTPLAAVRAALATLARLALEARASLGDPRVDADDLGAIVDEIAASTELAAAAAARAAGFVRGIKAHTRDLGRREPRRFDAVPVVEEALLLLAHAGQRGGVATTLRSSAPAIEVVGDPGRLVQIVVNLVKNAVEASPPGAAAVEVELSSAADAVTLTVVDHGAGIAPADQARIFDPMFTTKPVGEGTGLGLTIVHDLVVGDFGGAIDVASSPGLGTRVVVRLPVATR